MKIREDIYLEIIGYESLQKFLQGQANMAFSVFKGLFSSKDEIIQYLENLKEPKIARLFLEIGKYYHFVKTY